MARETDLYQVKRDGGAAFVHDGVMTYIKPYMIVRKGHAIMKGREDLFEPLYVHYDLDEAVDTKTESKKAEDKEPEARKPEPDAPRSQVRADQQGARTRTGAK